MTDIRKARVAKGITQEHLAKAAGVSVRTVRRIEAEGGGSPETLMALKAVVGDDDVGPCRPISTEVYGPDEGIHDGRRLVAIVATYAVLLIGVLLCIASINAISPGTVTKTAIEYTVNGFCLAFVASVLFVYRKGLSLLLFALAVYACTGRLTGILKHQPGGEGTTPVSS